jgi:hypothetical protein
MSRGNLPLSHLIPVYWNKKKIPIQTFECTYKPICTGICSSGDLGMNELMDALNGWGIM